jgi:hypothetical protein
MLSVRSLPAPDYGARLVFHFTAVPVDTLNCSLLDSFFDIIVLMNDVTGKKGMLPYLVKRLESSSNKSNVGEENLWYAIRGAIDPGLLIANLAEVMRMPAQEVEEILVVSAFGDLVAKKKLAISRDLSTRGPFVDYTIPSGEPPFQDIFSITFNPPLNQPIRLSPSQHEAMSLLRDSLLGSFESDPFLRLYRKEVLEYFNNFMDTEAKLIDNYLARHFQGVYPRYIVNSGIGANEQFNHYPAYINNTNPDRRLDWLIVDSPRHLTKIPLDATIENTLFMEFSRSGKTEETIMIHEYTPRDAKRIVFANKGPLKDIGIRDNNLVIDLPDQVAGRFGRNKTPILLAPMYIAGMDVRGFWNKIDMAIREFDLSLVNSLPVQIAQFIYLCQQKNKVNHIYLGCNDDILRLSADELLQFWNEGANKNKNDIMMSGYFGLPRDSHATIEGLLANSNTKFAIFLLHDKLSSHKLHPMIRREIDPIDPNHQGLYYGDEENILAEANYQRFSEVMPTIKIYTHGELKMEHAAVLGQLWADVTFCYSKMMNVDPGSNPEVKDVRDRSARLLAEAASSETDPGNRTVS